VIPCRLITPQTCLIDDSIRGIGDGELIISPDPSSIVAHISEQPETIRNALWGRILAEIRNARLDCLQRTDVELNNIERI
jgi:hypothetical protein